MAGGIRQRLSEAVSGGGGGFGPAPEGRSIREELRAATVMAEHYQENLARLEDSMEAGEWKRTAWQVEQEFTRPGLDDICELSRAMYLSHPLIKRVVNVTTYYTMGQGISYKAMSERIEAEVLKPHLADETNRRELYSHQATLLTDVDQLVEGNVFMALFTDVEGNVKVRSFPTKQIREIYHKPGDSQTITYYRRQWTEVVLDERTGRTKSLQQEALYPDHLYQPKNKPTSIGRLAVKWDSPIIHKRSGGMKDMQFGIPETYAALDWARAYRKFLENWHTLVASLAKFAWNATTKGSKLKAGKEKLRSHLEEGDDFDDENETVPGGVYLGKPGDKLEAIPKTGAHTSAEDARPSRLMVAAASDLPDTIVSGDVDVGNFATSKTLDRPTWLRMRTRQFTERDFRQSIFRYIVDAKVRAGKLPGTIEWERDGSNSWVVLPPDLQDGLVKVSFPPILQEDTLDMVKAIIAAATLEGKTESETIPPELVSKMLMETLEVEDVEAALEEISPEERVDLQKQLKDMQDLARKAVGGENDPPKPEDKPKEGD
jgi:hypothetical protein